jgi:DNA repair exonuclease SbcCD ATPase subunit
MVSKEPFRFSIRDFDGYDMVMLGDIHKRQFLNKQKSIAYAGSLIQQHRGEHLMNHGIIEWELSTRSGVFHNIRNVFGFYEMTYYDHELQYPTYDKEGTCLPSTIRLYITRDNSITDPDLKRHVRSYMKQKGVELLSITVFTAPVQSSLPANNGEFDVGGLDTFDFKLQNVAVQNKYIEMYMKQESSYSINEIRAVQECNNDVNKQYSENKQVTCQQQACVWNLKTMRFHNLFSYGENNNIDFRTMAGTVGFIGPNHIGKSSLIDIILYALFDTCSRCSSSIVVANEILNHESTWFEVVIDFCISDVDYRIKKRGVKSKSSSSVKVTVDFWEYRVDGTMVSLNGVQRSDTRKIIEQYIGSYDDFITTSVSLQNNTGYEFIDMTTGSRVDCLNRLLRMNVFDDLRKIASATYEQLKACTQQLSFDVEDEKEIRERLCYIRTEIGELKLGIDEQRENIRVSTQKKTTMMHILDSLSKPDMSGVTAMGYTHPTNQTEVLKLIDCIRSERDVYTSEHTSPMSTLADPVNDLDEVGIQSLQEHLVSLEQSVVENKIKRDALLDNAVRLGDIDRTEIERLEQMEDTDIALEKGAAETRCSDLARKHINISIQYSEFEQRIGDFDVYTVEKLHEWTEKKASYDILETKITMAMDLLESMKDHTYDHECMHCMNNPLVKKKQETEQMVRTHRTDQFELAFSEKEYRRFQKSFQKRMRIQSHLTKLRKKKADNKLKQECIQQRIVQYEKSVQYISNSSSINVLCTEQEDLETSILTITDTIARVEKTIVSSEEIACVKQVILSFQEKEEFMEQLLDYFEKVDRTKRGICCHTAEIASQNELLLTIENKYYSLLTEKGTKEEQYRVYTMTREKYKDSAKKLTRYDNYLKVIQKNGIQYYMMTQAIPTLEHRVNNILRRMVDFTIRFDLEKKRSQKYIHIHLIRDNTSNTRIHECPIQLSSGFEKFLTNIAVKMGIRSIAKVPKLNMMMIDEGFGNFDEENITNTVNKLFDVLNHLLDYTVVISHIETLRDSIHTQIPILLKDHHSSVTMGETIIQTKE